MEEAVNQMAQDDGLVVAQAPECFPVFQAVLALRRPAGSGAY